MKSTPTPEFLSKLGHFDASRLPYSMGYRMRFVDALDPMRSDSRIPRFFLWLHQQVSPQSI